MQHRTSRASRQRARAPAPLGITFSPKIRSAPEIEARGGASSPASARAAALGATIAIVLVAMGACSSGADGLFGDAGGSSEGSGVGGADGSGGGATGSTTTTSSSSTSASTSSGVGGAASPMCGDGVCNGTETPNTCLKDCPSTCGDGQCDGAETSQTCPMDCNAPMCAHSVCVTGDELVDGCDACVSMVCAADPPCCTDNWDGQCVGEADSICGAGCCGDGACNGEDCNSCSQDCGTCPPPPTCPHSACDVGGPLNTTDCRDPCVAQTCAIDAGCCQPSPPMWTGECVALAQMTCGAEPCITAVCAKDPTCCSADWTQACVTLAVTECAVGCDCAHPICADGPKLDKGCNPCAAQVCEADPYCCNDAWDGYCVNEVATICGVICN